jgi:hypothetical protein
MDISANARIAKCGEDWTMAVTPEWMGLKGRNLFIRPEFMDDQLHELPKMTNEFQ